MAEINAIPWNGYNVVSTFSGGGGSCTGYRMAGYRVLWANEFIPAARDTYAANHPTSILDPRDIRTISPDEVLAACNLKQGELDLLDGSPPCFEAGTPVLTFRGVVPIEQVVAGDLVMTHKKRWRRVLRTMSRKAPTVLVEGRIKATADHRFYLREQTRHWDNELRSSVWTLGGPQWVNAENSSGQFGATPVNFPATAIPDAPAGFPYSENFWYMVGRWVGDGWLRLTVGDKLFPLSQRPKLQTSPVPCLKCGKASRPHSRHPGLYGNYCSAKCAQSHNRSKRKRPRGEVLICTGIADGPALKAKLVSCGAAVGESVMKTSVRFYISRRKLALWLKQWFGEKADGKTLPGWVFGMDQKWRRALFNGYMDADGSNGNNSTSVSRCLTTGVAILAGTLGKTVSIGRILKTETATIEGRVVRQKTVWQARMADDDHRYTQLEDGLRWRKIRKAVKPASAEAVVYDFEVEDDHSFVADLFVVHNCSAFSTAGKRSKDWGKTKDYSDGAKQVVDDLFFEFARLLRGIRPKTFVAENVSGLVKGVAKGYFIEILGALKACGYKVQARLLDASWLGVPQARQRIIFVGVRGDLGFDPVHPTPMPYQYTMRDALPWIRAVVKDTKGNNGVSRKEADEPSMNIVDQPHHYTVESESWMEGKAVGEEWEKLSIGEQSDKYFQLVKPNPDQPTPTVTATGGSNSIASVTHPYENRKFSIGELKRICSFPDDYQLTGSYAQQWERLGRSVPPVMARKVSEAIQHSILDPLEAKAAP